MMKKKNTNPLEITLRVPKGYAHFLRSGAGSHGNESRRTQRRKAKQVLRFDND
jgi:hypothetical protein